MKVFIYETSKCSNSWSPSLAKQFVSAEILIISDSKKIKIKIVKKLGFCKGKDLKIYQNMLFRKSKIFVWLNRPGTKVFKPSLQLLDITMKDLLDLKTLLVKPCSSMM